MKEIDAIEAKLENGFQIFTAQEVAYLLNHIRIYKQMNEARTTKLNNAVNVLKGQLLEKGNK